MIYVNRHDGVLIEESADLLDKDDPEECVKRKTEDGNGKLNHCFTLC